VRMTVAGTPHMRNGKSRCKACLGVMPRFGTLLKAQIQRHKHMRQLSLYRHFTLAVASKPVFTNDRPCKTKHQDADLPFSVLSFLSPCKSFTSIPFLNMTTFSFTYKHIGSATECIETTLLFIVNLICVLLVPLACVPSCLVPP